MWEIELQLAISWYQTKFSVVGLYHIQLCFWPKRTHRNLKINQVVSTTIVYLHKVNKKAPLLKTAHMQLFRYEEGELAPT